MWVSCYGVIAPVQAWSFANSLFDTRQAKRLFGLIGAGASLGAMTAGVLARVLVEPVGGTVNLLLVLALLIASAAVIVVVANLRIRRVGLSRRGRPVSRPFSATWGEIVSSPYLRLLAGIVFAVAIATQWTSLQLGVVAKDHFSGSSADITEFYGMFSFVTGVCSFLVQLLVTGRVLRHWGVSAAILALPLALATGNFLILLAPAFWSVLLTNGFDQGLRFSVDKATYELLYLPIPPGDRTSVKNAIDIVVNRVADAVGAVLLGLLTQGFFVLPGLHLDLRGTAAVNLVTVGIWLALAWRVRAEYIRTIQDSIHRHRLDTERGTAAVTERSAADVLRREADRRRSLGSPLRARSHRRADDAQVASGAADAADASRCRHPASCAGRLERHGGRSDRRPGPGHAAGSRHRRAHRGPAVSVAGIGHRPAAPDRGARRLRGLLDQGRRRGVSCRARARTEPRGGPADGRAHGAQRRARGAPRSRRGRPADRRDPGADVRRSSSAAHRRREHRRRAAGHPRRTSVRARGRSRAGPDPGAGPAGAGGRSGRGPGAAGQHGGAVDRRRAEGPRTCRSKCGASCRRCCCGSAPSEAEQTLVASLLESDGTIRHRIIASLNKLRAVRPDIHIDAHVVELLLAAEIAGHYRSYQVLGPLRAQLKDGDPVIQALRHSMEQELERIFRLMALLLPQTGLHDAYVGVRSSNTTVRANALEFLDNVLKPELRHVLVPLLDAQVTVEERIEIANRLVGAPLETPHQAVATLLDSEDPWLRSCAIQAVGTLRLGGLVPQLKKYEGAADPLVREAVVAARARLAGDTRGLLEPQHPAPPDLDMGVGAG